MSARKMLDGLNQGDTWLNTKPPTSSVLRKSPCELSHVKPQWGERKSEYKYANIVRIACRGNQKMPSHSHYDTRHVFGQRVRIRALVQEMQKCLFQNRKCGLSNAHELLLGTVKRQTTCHFQVALVQDRVNDIVNLRRNRF